MTHTPDRPDGSTWRRWGIDPEWSRLIEVGSHDGGVHRWHVLDTGPARPGGATLVCVHGNPTWGYAWKSFLQRFGEADRVIAIDQLGMGYTERLDPVAGPRRYADRVADLGDVIQQLDLDPASPLVLAAHDWGGAIAMGWAIEHRHEVAAMVLCNTGIAVPDGRRAPTIIRLAAAAPFRDLVCRRTSIFVEGTVRLSGRRITRADREAFRAPYRRSEHRSAIADFVGDIPLTDDHPSGAALEAVATGLADLGAPTFLAWGAKDIVFDDDFAADLMQRLPNVDHERFADANHLVMAEADVASTVGVWLRDVLPSRSGKDADGKQRVPRPPHASFGRTDPTSSVFDGLRRRQHDQQVAVVDLAADDRIDFATFGHRVDAAAAGLIRRGLTPGDRVAMLTPPGVDLLIVVYAVWRAGGVTVIADRGLGLRGLGRAIASTRPEWTLGPRRAGFASALMRWAPTSRHIEVARLVHGEDDVAQLPDDPPSESTAAILFTSGATGPAKGVEYLHRQLVAQRDALASTYGITDDDRLVAAFAPFALYGPALGVSTALTDCDVTTPGALTVQALDDACRAVDATMAFASPAALANVAATSRGGTSELGGVARLRLLLSAGAPVPAETLHAIRALAPRASIRTPYGMTEALPVADIDLVGIDLAQREFRGRGVCVGSPVAGAEARIVPISFDALDGVPAPLAAGQTGEILVRAPWVSNGYIGRWHIGRISRPGAGWHRSGDVGHIDQSGQLWIEGRSVHLIDTMHGTVTPVPVERAIERALAPSGVVTVGRVAAVAVGPPGCQQVVVVVERPDDGPGLAGRELAKAVRAAVDVDVAAVLVTKQIPVDIRHNAKIDRGALAAWASDILT